MAGDHGVVAEGVSPYPQDVTWQMVANFSAGGAAINQIARACGRSGRGLRCRRRSRPDRVPRYPPRQCRARHREHGARPCDDPRAACCRRCSSASAQPGRPSSRACTLLGTGEMGIGNTTAAAALTAAFTGADVELVVGRGTGLDDDGVAHKAQVVAGGPRGQRTRAISTRSAYSPRSADSRSPRLPA